MKIKLSLQLEVTYNKHGKFYRCHCKQYDLQGKSEVSFEEAYKDLQDQIDIEIWANSFDLEYRVTELGKDDLSISKNGELKIIKE